jgi:molybdate/tungstate transport system ATP-binding protein
MNGLEMREVVLHAGDFTIDEVSLAIRPGEYFILMGHTGAGKSLLMKAICGLQPVFRGSIFIDGTDVTFAEPRKRHIGYVPQDSGLFPHLNVRDNILFALDVLGVGKKDALSRAHYLAEEVGISALLDRSPAGLSGGERQKVALARAIVRRPRLLLLDEPVSALDNKTHAEICALLRRIHGEYGHTTVHICHNSGEAEELGDRIAVMNAGRVISIEERNRLP